MLACLRERTDMKHFRPFACVVLLMGLSVTSFHSAWAQARSTESPARPAAAPASPEAIAVKPPAELLTYGRQWAINGRGSLRFFGFKAYDATLWLPAADPAFSFEKPFALEILYATTVKGKDIANTSLIELQRISKSSPEQITAWAAFMDATFVDVKAGDQLTGVHLPKTGVRFFLNGKLAGELNDAAFSEAFFKIWLDPKTRRAELRDALLAQVEPPARQAQ